MPEDSTSEEVITITAEIVIRYEECPNCAEGDNRWIYNARSAVLKDATTVYTTTDATMAIRMNSSVRNVPEDSGN